MTKHEIYTAAAILAIGTTLGCAGDAAEVPGDGSMLPAGQEAASATALAVRAANEFASDVLAVLAEEEGNLFFSPYSIETCLLLAAEGARGATAREMGAVLRVPASLSREGDADVPWNLTPLHAGNSEATRALAAGATATPEVLDEIEALRRTLDPGSAAGAAVVDTLSQDSRWTKTERLRGLVALVHPYEFHSANAIWIHEGFPVREEYTHELQRWHGAVSHRLDFDASEAARSEINAWIAERTGDRIRELLRPGSIHALTRLVLTNAVTFRGEWLTPFAEGGTQEADFLCADGDRVRVPLMVGNQSAGTRYGAFHGDGSFFATPHVLPMDPREWDRIARYPGEDGFAIVEIPYKGDRLSMLVLAPDRSDGLPDLEDAMTAGQLAGWVERMEERAADVWLPRFHLEYRPDLRNVLRRLGMEVAFDSRADFSGVSESASLFVSDVVHEAVIDVNERGTEAVAATGLTETLGMSALESVPFTPAFRADRPFLFLIRDRPTGLILFLGRYALPE